jgi:hypothetical protein
MFQLAEGEGSGSCDPFCDAAHSIPHIQEAYRCQKLRDDPVLLSPASIVQSNLLPETLMRFMEIFDGVVPRFSPETFDDLMLLA